MWKGYTCLQREIFVTTGLSGTLQNFSHRNKGQFKVFYFSMHLCRFYHQSDLRYVADIFYGRGPRFVPIFWGPGPVKERIMTDIEPPSSIILYGTVTTVPLIVVSIHGTERRTVQIGARVATVDNSIS